MKDKLVEAGFATLSIAGFLALWEGSVAVFHVPAFFIPPPSLVLFSMYNSANLYLFHLGFTLYATLVAFIIAMVLGISLAMLIIEVRAVERALMPVLIALQSMPRIALAPIIIVWFGYGPPSKIVIGAFSAFFPIFVNALQGMRTMDSDQMALMRSLRASKLQILCKIKLPTALPFLLAGANLGIIMAMLSVIVGEFVGANRGLGYLIVTQSTRMDMAGVMGAIFYLSAAGVLFHYGLQYLRRRLLFWSAGSEVAGSPM